MHWNIQTRDAHWYIRVTYAPSVISGFRREVDVNCALQGYYASSNLCVMTQKSAVLNLCTSFNTINSAFCLHIVCYVWCIFLYNKQPLFPYRTIAGYNGYRVFLGGKAAGALR